MNALSEMLTVTIKRDGFIYEQRFENGGKPVTTLKKSAKPIKRVRPFILNLTQRFFRQPPIILKPYVRG